MIPIPEVLTAGSTETLQFELYDAKGDRAKEVPPGVSRISIRRSSTPRTKHELSLLNASLDHLEGIVTIELSGSDTQSIGPDLEGEWPATQKAVADIRIISADAIDYYGPYEFTLRLPETYTPLGEGPRVTKLDITDIAEETATATLTIDGADGSPVYLRWQAVGDVDWGTALSMTSVTSTVVFTMTGLDGGTTYRVRASFDPTFRENVEAARFDSQFLIPQRRYSFWTTPFTTDGQQGPIPTETAILAQGAGARTDDLNPRTPINVIDSAIAGWIWFFIPYTPTHYSNGTAFGFNQLVVFQNPGTVEIDGFEYEAWVNPNGLNPIVTQENIIKLFIY